MKTDFLFYYIGKMIANYQTPDEIFGELFVDVQTARIFNDSKTFADCLPKSAPEKILRAYSVAKKQAAFSLYEFVLNHFSVPGGRASDFSSDRQNPIRIHLDKLWSVLSRPADNPQIRSSLIPLPHPYVVPGGRFREIYYWDSYFTQLGLAVSGHWVMVENMIDNFSYLIDQFGHVPNGNRTYFLSRSQPPFFAFMVELLARHKGDEIILKYHDALEREYAFWMQGCELMNPGQAAHRRVVRLGAGQYLNRYYDDNPKPRQESYLEDIHLASQSSRKNDDLFLQIRAACESGWDFSSRWCEVPGDLTTIQTTYLIPVDLNCCLLKLERMLIRGYKLLGKIREGEDLRTESKMREELLMRYCWNSDKGYFFDYNFVRGEQSDSINAAGIFPLFLGLVPQDLAERCLQFTKQYLWMSGGISTTDLQTGQQWDAPNGWAPLQWVTYKGFSNYGFFGEARDLATRWINLNIRVFEETGKMMEKYNVMDTSALAGGGEYPVQDGFGWSNGVLLAMMDEIPLSVR